MFVRFVATVQALLWVLYFSLFFKIPFSQICAFFDPWRAGSQTSGGDHQVIPSTAGSPVLVACLCALRRSSLCVDQRLLLCCCIVVPLEQFHHFPSMKPYDTQVTPASRPPALVSQSPHNPLTCEFTRACFPFLMNMWLNRHVGAILLVSSTL